MTAMRRQSSRKGLVHYRLVGLRVEALGPATVGIDAHGRNLYAEEQRTALARLPELMARLDAAREATCVPPGSAE